MDRAEIKSLVDAAGVPTAYGWYAPGSEPERPYAVLHFLYSSDLRADNRHYARLDNWQLDLVCDRRSEATEGAVETALEGAGLCWSKTESDEADDAYVRTIYKFRTIGD